jgi:hypothetical protein
MRACVRAPLSLARPARLLAREFVFAPRAAGPQAERAGPQTSRGAQEEASRSICSRLVLYPELPWGAPPSWEDKDFRGRTFLMYWELITCLACFYVGIKVRPSFEFRAGPRRMALSSACAHMQTVERRTPMPPFRTRHRVPSHAGQHGELAGIPAIPCGAGMSALVPYRPTAVVRWSRHRSAAIHARRAVRACTHARRARACSIRLQA